MGLFSRKSKSKKDVANDNKQKPAEAHPKKTLAKFVPRHQRIVGAAAQGSGPTTHDGYQETISSPPSPSFRHREDGYYHDVPAVPSFKNRSNANGKHQITAGYYVPHNNSSDSGYESAEPLSAVHSRGPSELNLHDHSRTYVAHNGALPELQLDGASNTPGMEDSGHSTNVDNVSPLDLNSDTRSIKSNRSISKRTRFEDDVEPMPPLDQMEQHRKDSDPATCSLAAPRPEHSQAPFFVQLEMPRPHTVTVRHTNAGNSSHQPQSNQGASMPPLCILEGLKVNKKGKVLDEEGDPIGELVDGDLLDCVRQKVNATGEVLDEYGRTVGRVCTCASVSGPVDAVPQQITTESQLTTTQDFDDSPATSQSQVTTPSEAPKVVEFSQDTTLNDSGDQLLAEPAIVQLASGAQPPTPTQDAKRISRSASEKSLSELSKPYARPTMSSVPENNVPEDDAAPASPGMFSYKGDIPVVDGPATSNRRSRSPPHPAQLLTPTQILPGQPPGPSHYAKLALVGGHSNNTLYPPMRPMSTSSRRATTPLMGGPVPVQRLHPVLKKTNSNGYSFDRTPSGSDAGSDPSSSDDGRMLTMGHSRTGSVKTTATVSKPRTYFTHAGKVTVDSETTAATKPDPPAAPVATEKKKKSRMSMSFGKKSKVAA